ncbi:hypothetical protein HanIR_Chr10g0484961 [Helianthus annuus]|nr:hypothetical protein HanIR_Chr10g0484961 [Helianthus annuus]
MFNFLKISFELFFLYLLKLKLFMPKKLSIFNYFGVLCYIIFNIYLFFYMFLFPYPSRPRFLNFLVLPFPVPVPVPVPRSRTRPSAT